VCGFFIVRLTARPLWRCALSLAFRSLPGRFALSAPPRSWWDEVVAPVVDEATDALTTFSVYQHFKGGKLFIPSLVAGGVNIFARLCLGIYQLARPGKGTTVNMAIPFVWIKMMLALLVMMVEPVSGSWLLWGLIHESSRKAAFIEGDGDVNKISTEDRASLGAINKLAMKIIGMRAHARVGLMIGVFEDVPALAIDVWFVAEGGLAASSSSDLALFVVSAAISILHSVKCIRSWRKLHSLADAAVARSPKLAEFIDDLEDGGSLNGFDI